MKKILSAIFCLVFLISCNKKKIFDGPDYYEDSFENYSVLDDLLLSNDQFWSFTQLTREESNITVDTTNVHSGSKSLKFTGAKAIPPNISKCSIAKQNMAFWEGETLQISAWYYIEGVESLEWLFLFDMEEQVAIGAGPGMRLALVENQVRVEYKFLEDDILQAAGQEVDFPRDQWVNLVWEVKLSRKNEGTVRLWQDGQLIIDSQNNTTLPTDLLYFQQGTKGMYSSIEIGITANPSETELVLWVDDVKFQKIN